MSTNRIDAEHQIQTSETDDTLRLAPDGAGGVEWSTAGSGGSIDVTDGITTVSPATSIDFTSGATVTDGGGGVAEVAITGGGSSPLTTKGDLYGHSTVDARVPVGTDGDVLTADSGATLGVSWQAPSGGGATIQYPALKPGSPTDDFAGASLGGGYSAHSNGGTFVIGNVVPQGIDWMGSSVELQFSEQFGQIYVGHSDTDLDFTWGGVVAHLPFHENSNSELMVGIAALNSSGTGVGVVAYTADTNAYFATITTWGYNTFSDTWAGRVIGSAQAGSSGALWFRLKRVSGTWTGYISKSGRAWDFTFATRADSITVDRLVFGLWFDNTKVYSGRLTADYFHVAV